MNDLNELNSILFQTLRGVRDGEIDSKKAQSITAVSTNIINNAKVQLHAYKATRGKVGSGIFGTTMPAIEEGARNKDQYGQMMEFALQLGYKSVAQAMEKMGKAKFEKAFHARKKEQGTTVQKDG